MKIKLRWVSGKIGGSVCRFNVWRGSEDRWRGGQTDFLSSEVGASLMEGIHISPSVRAQSDKEVKYKL